MKTIQQTFCRHEWSFVKSNAVVNEQLDRCVKCGLYRVWHRGIMTQYTSRTKPRGLGWEEHK
jgi:hypothetical protein